MRYERIRDSISARRRAQPDDRDWRVRRIEYLLNAGRMGEELEDLVQQVFSPKPPAKKKKRRPGQFGRLLRGAGE
jgi:hypothetical protein